MEVKQITLEFFFKYLNIRGFFYDTHLGQTAHFTEKIKKNTFKLMCTFFEKEDTQKIVINKLLDLVRENIK